MGRNLIYIAGLEHSGSTLLELFVSGASGHLGLGEIFQLIDRRNPIIDHLEGHRCSCGEEVKDCRFWAPLVARLRQLPSDDAAARYRAMADAGAQQAGAEVVLIDSSKVPDGLAAVASTGDFDVRVLHLTRDVRSWLVAKQRSYRRNKVASLASNVDRDGLLRGTARFLRRNPIADAMRWRQVNREIEEKVAAYGLPSLAVSYERLCCDTSAVRNELEQFLDIEIPPLDHPGQRRHNHSIFGNRMRFDRRKRSKISYDTKWLVDNCWVVPWLLSPGLRRENMRRLQQG